MANEPPFIVFTVSDDIATVGDYNRVILGIRGWLQDDCVSGRDPSGVTTTRPMLTHDRSGDRNNTQFAFVDIVFIRHRSGRQYNVRVRFLQDNLYALGFQLLDNQWREFEWDFYPNTRQRPRYLPNSQYITDFNGSYGSIPLGRVTLGGQGLRAALDALIDNAGANTPAANRALAGGMGTMALMFSEPARFDPILQHILREFQNSPSVADWLLTRAQRWSRYSGWVRYYLAHPNETWQLMTLQLSVVRNPGHPAEVVDVPIRSPVQLLKLMGILHNSPDDVRPRGPHDNY